MGMKIIIVGAGIAGLGAAIVLRQGDREIIILDQSSISQEIGATISLQTNASKIVEGQWGLASKLRERGSMVDEAFEVYNLDGDLQIRVPLSTKEKYGAERMMYHRADLHQTLKERATSAEFPGRPATLRTFSRVSRCDCQKGTVTFMTGEVLTADLIVGADGIKSAVRKSVLGQEILAKPTGLSAYRMMIPTADLERESEFSEVINPRKACTTMVVGRDRRLIMGPARNATIYGVVALVPDENLKEDPQNTSWTTEGDHDKMMKTLAKGTGLGLWQLRDLDPLVSWYQGRAILIGDAAHAMLPTQGQGASQAIEDAEALGAFFDGFEKLSQLTLDAVAEVNRAIFKCRFDRATTIQAYSREAAKPATGVADRKVKMNPGEVMDYNCSYDGALNWRKRQDMVA